MKDKFLNLLSEVKRPGIDKLTNWLTDKSDFMTAPASARYHGAIEGGLLDHSLTVYDWLAKLNVELPESWSAESMIICGLLHDVCKVNFYQKIMKSKKDGLLPNGKIKWIDAVGWDIEDRFPYGHGEKSVYIINEFIHLSVEEAVAIRWHMGAWGAESYTEKQSLSAAMEKYPLILALQMADQASTFWDKK